MAQRIYTSWIDAYMEYTQHTEAPENSHWWTAVSTIAGALRRQVWISQAYFEWTPCFYVILVSKPGIVNKSTTVNIGMDLLRKLEYIKFGPNAITWQALVTSLAGSAEAFTLDEAPEEYHTMSAITIAASELGTLLDPKNREMVDVLVDLWDGKRGVWKKVTKLNGEDVIENPWINIIACTTPAWLQANFPETLIGGGFASRCIFVYGEKKRHLVAYPADHTPPDHYRRAENLVHDLELITQIKGEYVLNPAAKAWGGDWYHNLHTSTPTHLTDDRLLGYLARKQTHLHKLSMVIAASRRQERVITAEDMQYADFMLTRTEKQMARVFERIGRVQSADALEVMLSQINGRPMPKVIVMRNMLRIVDGKEFNELVTSAINAGLISQTQRGNDFYLEATGADQNPTSH